MTLDIFPSPDETPESHTGPYAGDLEAAWLDEHVGELHSLAGLWVAVKGKTIHASSDDLEELLNWLTEAGLRDALVTQLPADVSTVHHMLA